MNIYDYYKILGVSVNSTDNEIKSAYRKLAKQWHPDINKNPGAESKFKQIQNAYDAIWKFKENKNNIFNFSPFQETFRENLWETFFNSATRNANNNIVAKIEFESLSEEDSNRLFDVLSRAGFKIKNCSILKGGFV